MKTKASELLKLSESFKLRDFDKADWDGLAGAERPDQGEPKYGELRLTSNNQDCFVVVDKNGINIESFDGMEFMAHLDMPFNYAVKFAERNLSPEMDETELKHLGFKITSK